MKLFPGRSLGPGFHGHGHHDRRSVVAALDQLDRLECPTEFATMDVPWTKTNVEPLETARSR